MHLVAMFADTGGSSVLATAVCTWPLAGAPTHQPCPRVEGMPLLGWLRSEIAENSTLLGWHKWPVHAWEFCQPTAAGLQQGVGIEKYKLQPEERWDGLVEGRTWHILTFWWLDVAKWLALGDVVHRDLKKGICIKRSLWNSYTLLFKLINDLHNKL